MKRSLSTSLVLGATVVLGWFCWQAFEEGPARADGAVAGEQGQGGVTVSGNGDVNGDNDLDLSDAIYLLAHLFQGGDPPEPCPGGGGDCTACEAELATCQAELLACTGGVPEVCNNNVDDDMDCNIDCADSDCDAAPNCLCDEASGADFVDCFATYASQEAADAAWESSSAQIGVDLSKAALGFELNPSSTENQSISYDLQQADALGPGNFPSSTAWVLRLHFRYSFLEFNESNQIFFGLSDMDKDTDHSRPKTGSERGSSPRLGGLSAATTQTTWLRGPARTSKVISNYWWIPIITSSWYGPTSSTR